MQSEIERHRLLHRVEALDNSLTTIRQALAAALIETNEARLVLAELRDFLTTSED